MVSAALIRNAVAKGLKQLGDLNRTVTWVQVTPGVYDPATGATADTTVSRTFLAPIVRASEKESAYFPGKARVQIVLVPYAALAGQTPLASDYFLIDGQQWEILQIRTPPTAAITKFYVNEP